MHIEPVWYFFYALFGLIVGSFLNVCIYRIPLGKSIVFPGSACPHCGSAIRPYDNIPVVSYVFLRGKCRGCGEPISMQYPVVELMTGAAFLACALKWDFTPPTFVNTLVLCLLIILAFTDYHHRVLNNVLTLPGIIVGIVLSPFQSIACYSDWISRYTASLLWPGDPLRILPWAGSIVGALVGSIPLFLLAIGYEKLRKRQGLGMGDVKMMAMLGAFLGCRIALMTIFAGSLLGSVIGLLLILTRHSNMQTKLPLGVFLAVGAAFMIFYGLPLWSWYWHMSAPR